MVYTNSFKLNYRKTDHAYLNFPGPPYLPDPGAMYPRTTSRRPCAELAAVSYNTSIVVSSVTEQYSGCVRVVRDVVYRPR